ncbi:MAG: YciK family oxidoreductase [Aequoribacter sp.]|mgnify:FL=1|jgi:NAD(P)-dependent dehydrogenase (short-subunit alcohol dehydrogenase family)|uniref:YciK family oxidoreductase n=1 Tax=Aequoribacter sp. TaxID=2847771 RepID=UPI003C5FA4B1
MKYSDIAPKNADVSLSDKVILITGAGAGIGEQLALGAARAGAIVLLLGRKEDALNAVYDQIISEGLAEPVVIPMDLGTLDEQQANQLSHMIGDAFGRLDGLVHNASLLGKLGPVATANLNEWSQVMTVNAFAPVVLTKALLPLLNESQGASIIFTSSGVGRQARAFWGAYSASKFATEAISGILAAELETDGIRVNCVNPGATNTKMRRAAFPGESPESIASAASLVPAYVFLLSEQAKGIHGASIDLQK